LGHAHGIARPIDFGDSYAQIGAERVWSAAFRRSRFFQLDKATGGLKRIQLERQRHGGHPRRRAVLGAIEAPTARPTRCAASDPAGERLSGSSRARLVAQRDRHPRNLSRHDDRSLRGLPRRRFDCRPCGLTGQLLVRISPPGADAAGCPVAVARSDYGTSWRAARRPCLLRCGH